MSPSSNYLRMYRKKSPLTQSDMGFLVDIKDISNISRYEKGQIKPSIEILITYHLLFNCPIESFFTQESEQVRQKLIPRLKELIQEIKKQQITLKDTPKINFLEEVIIRLNI